MMETDIKRRDFFKKAAALTAVAAFPNILLAKRDMDGSRKSITLYNIHTAEKVNSTYWAEGRYLHDEIEELNRLLRDFRTGDVHPMDLALFDLLYDIRTSIGTAAPFQVISGYRSPKTNAKLRKASLGVAKKSLHMQGRAIDISLPGVELNRLRLAARSLRRGGVGYYPKSGFVHVDTGRVRYW